MQTTSAMADQIDDDCLDSILAFLGCRFAPPIPQLRQDLGITAQQPHTQTSVLADPDES